MAEKGKKSFRPVVSVRLTNNLKKALDKKAFDESRPLSNYIKKILEDYLMNEHGFKKGDLE